MNLAKMSPNGQVTVPVEIRRHLNLRGGDKVLFMTNANGEVFIGNAAMLALNEIQRAFEGVAEEYGFQNESDVDQYISEMRYGKQKQS